MMSREVFQRLVYIDACIRRGECPTAGTLARGLNVSVRTVRRDLAWLRERCGTALAFDTRASGYRYTTDAPPPLPNVLLDAEPRRRPAPAAVRLRVWPPLAQQVTARRWQPIQRVARGRDGVVTLHLRTAAAQALKRWVLSLGAAAEVLSPKAFREQILTEIHALCARYQL